MPAVIVPLPMAKEPAVMDPVDTVVSDEEPAVMLPAVMLPDVNGIIPKLLDPVPVPTNTPFI